MRQISICNSKIIALSRGLIILLALLYANPAGAGDSYDSSKTTPDSTVSVTYTTDDGPHVYWQDDTTAYVIYLCANKVIKERFTVPDTLRFQGLCLDSDIEYKIPACPSTVDPEIIRDDDKIFVISDIHGEYKHFLDILIKGGVIDDNHHWIWGKGHLVIDGDVTDRGAHVTECLWLIYRLEQEALAQGGSVHFLLGNHELMVLRGDNRYVHERYMKGIVKKTRIRHEDFYGPNMELGRWLRTKNTAVNINNILFIHGGMPPYLIENGYSLKELNEKIRGFLDLRSSELAFNEEAKLLFGGKGPFWYRGYHYEMDGRYEQASPQDIAMILEYYDADAVVVGHSQVASITALYDKRVMAVDVIVEDIGGLEALLWEDNRFFRITTDGSRIPIE